MFDNSPRQILNPVRRIGKGLVLVVAVALMLAPTPRAFADDRVGTLFVGWNLLGLTGEGTPAQFAERWPCVTAIWYYNGVWNAYFPGHPEASDYPDGEFQSFRGYWVYCK